MTHHISDYMLAAHMAHNKSPRDVRFSFKDPHNDNPTLSTRKPGMSPCCPRCSQTAFGASMRMHNKQATCDIPQRPCVPSELAAVDDDALEERAWRGKRGDHLAVDLERRIGGHVFDSKLAARLEHNALRRLVV